MTSVAEMSSPGAHTVRTWNSCSRLCSQCPLPGPSTQFQIFQACSCPATLFQALSWPASLAWLCGSTSFSRPSQVKRCGVKDHFHALKGLAAAAPMVRSVRSGPPSNGSEFTYTRPHQRWGVKDHFHTLGGPVAVIQVSHALGVGRPPWPSNICPLHL